MKTLIKQIEQWAEERNLIQGSTPEKQFLKLMEEFGELCGGVAKDKPEIIKDSIGDCFVVLVILNRQLKTDVNIPSIIEEILPLMGLINDEPVTTAMIFVASRAGSLADSLLKELLDEETINFLLYLKDNSPNNFEKISDRFNKLVIEKMLK